MSYIKTVQSRLSEIEAIDWYSQPLGVLYGIILPIVTAVIYPTYVHTMPTKEAEWTRLVELPFVISEVIIILIATHKGMKDSDIFKKLPTDVKVAGGLWVLAMFSSSLFLSKSPVESVFHSLMWLIHIRFGFAVFFFMERNRLNVSSFMASLGVGLLALVALTVVKFLWLPPLDGVPGGVIDLSSSLPGFISVRHFGSWTGAVAAGFTAWLLCRPARGLPDWREAFFFLASAMTVWSGTRAAIFAMIVTAVAVVIRQRKIPSLTTIGRLAMLSGAACIVAWLLLPDDTRFYLWVTSDTMGGVNQFTSGRVDLWLGTIAGWLRSPVIGLGSGSIMWEVYIGWPHTQPHNFVLQFLISWGALGGLPAFWLLFRSLHIADYGQEPRSIALYGLVAGLLSMAMLEGMLHYPRFIILIVIALTYGIQRNVAR